MKLKKIAGIILASAVISGCASENGKLIYNNTEKKDSIYLQEKEGQKLYRNDDDNFKIACYDNWDIKIDEDGYLVKIILNTEKGNVWLGMRKDTLEPDAKDIDSLLNKYTGELKNGMVKTAGVTIGGKKGKWIKVEPVDKSGIALKNKRTGEKVEIDDSNLVTSDENEPREDLIFISDDNFAYVFLYHADTVELYTDYENDIEKFLGTFQFI